jgi:hypothetical protein
VKRLPLAATVLAALWLCACGGSSNPAPPSPTGKFSNASLKGQYAFSISGVDGATGAFFAEVGSFAADGAGNISGGLADIVDLSGTTAASQVSFSSGSYQIQANGRGQIKILYTGGGLLQLSIALKTGSQGLAVETDQFASASGNFYLQTPTAFTAASLRGNYVFDVSGVSFTATAAAAISIIGQFAADGNASLTGGTVDENNGNVAAPSGPLTLTATAFQLDTNGNGTNFGRGTLTLDGRSFAFYIVDGTRLKLLQEDLLGGSSGDAVLQASAVPVDNSGFTGSFVYLVGGAGTTGALGPVARAARFTADGSGGLAAISLDDNNNGSYTHISQGSNISAATYAIDTAHAGSGRGTATFKDSSAGTYTLVFYLSSASAGVIQDTSLGLISDGALRGQAAGPFTVAASAGSYIFNWSGVQLGSSTAVPFEEDFVGQYVLANTSSNNISGVVDFVELGLSSKNNPAFLNFSIGGTLTVKGDGTNNNTYQISINGTPSATFSYQAYFVDANTLFLLCSDNTRTTAGIVALQP